MAENGKGDLEALVAKSKETDQVALLTAKEMAKKKMASDPRPADLRVVEKAQQLLDRAAAPGPGLVFATQLEALDYLQGQGYKVSKSKFNRDKAKGLVPTTAEGFFEANGLMGYAKVHCPVRERADDAAAGQAALERLKADAEYKRVMAERGRLKMEQEQGRLIAREDHERDLAARAAFFRREMETFGPRLGPQIILAVGGDDGRLPEFLALWRDEVETLMDAWAQDRDFVLDQGDQGEALDQTPAGGEAELSPHPTPEFPEDDFYDA